MKKDFTKSVYFIRREKPVVGKCLLMISGINLFLSAMIVVALPYLITEVLSFEETRANTLYGFAQGALAGGGLAGAMCAGIFREKLTIKRAGNLLTACALSVFPMSFTLLLTPSETINYMIIVLCCFAVMVFSTVFSVQMMSFIQTETPKNLVGKVIAVMITVSTCAQPLGNALYGILFELGKGAEFAVILFSGIVSLSIAMKTKNIFARL